MFIAFTARAGGSLPLSLHAGRAAACLHTPLKLINSTGTRSSVQAPARPAVASGATALRTPPPTLLTGLTTDVHCRQTPRVPLLVSLLLIA